jgi:8-amino-7-oxononanoate synthase
MSNTVHATALDSVCDELAALERDGLLRRLRTFDTEPCGARLLDGVPTLDLCSNDYLGLARDRRLGAAAADATGREGFGAGASRLITGTRGAHQRLERDIRGLTGAEAALTFSSGFAANLAVLGALLGPEDLAISDRHNHASLIDGLRLTRATRRVVPHLDIDAVCAALSDADRFRRVAIVTEGLFSMDGDEAPLAALLDAARTAGALLVVDDAHGTGVLGPTGGGALEAQGVGPEPGLIRIGTFGKAFGAAGAFVAAAEPVVDLVVNRGRAFVFSTAQPPPVAAAASEAVRIAAAEPWRRERCLRVAARLRRGFAEAGLPVSPGRGPIVPVVVGSAERVMTASRRLHEELGVFVAGIRPPTVPEGTARLRVTASASHSDEDVERAVAAVAGVLA